MLVTQELSRVMRHGPVTSSVVGTQPLDINLYRSVELMLEPVAQDKEEGQGMHLRRIRF